MAAAGMLLAGRVTGASLPQYVRLSYPQADTSTTIGIAWNSPSVEDPTEVEFGPDASYGQTATGTAFQGPSELGAIHEVTLTGLKPGTTYHYRVGGPGAFGEDRTFTTAPADPCSPFGFVVLGDDRSDDNTGASPRWGPILMEAMETGPLFVLNTGDLVREGKEAKQWRNFLERSDPALSLAAHMPTLGNHDDGPTDGDGAVYNQVLHLPRNGVTNTEDFYWFTVGNAIVVSLSTQTFEENGMAAQAAWLDEVLTANPKLWKFVFFHHPVYTSSSLLGLLDISHPPNEVGQNAALTAVFDKHHVDFVFYGHNHFYERFEPMRGKGGADEGEPVGDPAKGTFYVVTGGGGALTYNIATALFCGGAKGSAKCAGDHHFIRLEVEGNKLTYTARATAQQLLGNNPSNSKNIETFSYEKAWPDGVNPCLAPPLEPGPEPMPEPAAEPVPEAGEEPEDREEPEPAPEPVPEGLPQPDAGAPDVPSQPEPSGPDLPKDTGTPPVDPGQGGADPSPGVPEAGSSNPSGGGCSSGPVSGAPALCAVAAALAALFRRRRDAW